MNPSETLDCAHGSSVEFSAWVKRHHRGFCKLESFPIETHEQECLSLLQRIEASRFANKEKEKGGTR